MKFLPAIISLTIGASIASAETPRVVTSIVPVQGLVADIMEGVGEPEVLLAEPTSTHDFSLRPSQLRAIGKADVLIYVGHDLEPWLEKALQSSDQNDVAIALGELPEVKTLEARELDGFGDHDEEEHDHDHAGDIDPHLWLSPENAELWLKTITETLVQADPENEADYRGNLEKTLSKIASTVTSTKQDLAALYDMELIVTHDSIQYFEDTFDLHAFGALSASDGQKSGARNLNDIIGHIGPNSCVIEDITHPNKISESLPEGIKFLSVDPMGYDALDAENYYSQLLTNISNSLLGCLD